MDKVEVRNNSRRALLIKVPGQALHLQPGSSAEVPRAYLQTEELSALVLARAVLVVSPARAAKTDEGPTLVAAEVSAATDDASESEVTVEVVANAPAGTTDERPGASPPRGSKKPR
jgi:hypothetical protein